MLERSSGFLLLFCLSVGGCDASGGGRRAEAPAGCLSDCAQASEDVYVLGSSHSGDAVPPLLDGEVGWQVYCDDPLDFIFHNPYSHCGPDSTPWPEVLESPVVPFRYVAFQPMPGAGATREQDASHISSWIGRQPPETVGVLHASWPPPHLWEAALHDAAADPAVTNYTTDYYYELLDELEARNPGRTFVLTRSNEMLDYIFHDPDAPVAFDEMFRDASGGMSEGFGKYLQHNAMRQATGQPVGVLPGETDLDESVLDYLDHVIALHPPGHSAAPGVVGSAATMETLEWIWRLERVPFPHAIDHGQWSDYYFSASAGGDWPEGRDSNDCRTPERACESAERAREVCFGGPFRRCNFDRGDTWTASDGWTRQGIGRITDADVTLSAGGLRCPTGFVEAHEQPCFWFRSSPGGRATFDARDSLAPTDFWAMRTLTRTHLLVEAIDMICDSRHGSKACVDSFDASIVTLVAGDFQNGQPYPRGTNNVISAHGVSALHLYGRSDLSYAFPDGGGGSPTFGANGQGSIAIHSSGTATACSGCMSFALNQSTGNIAPSLEAEAAETDSAMLVTGLRMVGSEDDGARGIAVVTNDPPHTGRAHLIHVSTSFKPNGSWSTFYQPRSLDGGGTIESTFLHPTLEIDGLGGAAAFIQQSADHFMTPTDRFDYHVAGALFEPSGKGATPSAIVRIADPDWSQSDSTLRIVDSLYEATPEAWSITDPSGDCFRSTATSLADCINPLRSTPIEVVNVDAASPQASGRASGGSASTLLDAGSGWTPDQWIGGIVRITEGTGSLQSRRITDSDASSLSVSPDWDVVPSSDSRYTITFYGGPEDGVCLEQLGAQCAGHVAQAAEDYSVDWPLRVQVPAFIAGRRLDRFLGDPLSHRNAGRVRGGP